jgi:hypothetical protein
MQGLEGCFMGLVFFHRDGSSQGSGRQYDAKQAAKNVPNISFIVFNPKGNETQKNASQVS